MREFFKRSAIAASAIATMHVGLLFRREWVISSSPTRPIYTKMKLYDVHSGYEEYETDADEIVDTAYHTVHRDSEGIGEYYYIGGHYIQASSFDDATDRYRQLGVWRLL